MKTGIYRSEADDTYKLTMVFDELRPAIFDRAVEMATKALAEKLAEDFIRAHQTAIFAKLDVQAIANLVTLEVSKRAISALNRGKP